MAEKRLKRLGLKIDFLEFLFEIRIKDTCITPPDAPEIKKNGLGRANYELWPKNGQKGQPQKMDFLEF